MQQNLSFLSSKKGSSGLSKLQQNILALPYWVQQYLYVELRENLSKYSNIDRLDLKTKSDLVQNYIPTPTSTGQRYIRRRFNQFAINMNISKYHIQLLDSLGIKKTIIDICNENKWSLIFCSKVLVECIELGVVEPLSNNNIANNVYYLAGKIRLGEYLLRMNKLSLDQVDQALYTQKEISQQIGENTKIGELLVNLGFIQETDKNDILCLKENSKQALDLQDETEIMNDKIKELESKIELLTFENNGIKEDLLDYQNELLEKTNRIIELEEQVQEKNNKKFSLKNLFPLRLCTRNT